MTDEITDTGYTEGSYGPFGIAVFYVQNERDTIAYRRIIFYRQKCQFGIVKISAAEKSPKYETD